MQTSIEVYLNKILVKAFEKCNYDSKYATVVVSTRPELSQFQCNGAMPLAKQVQQNPFDIAENIINSIEDKSIFSNICAVRPGFINITLSDQFLANWSNKLTQDPRKGIPSVEKPRNVVVDFGGPNVAKPMHVGHIRSTLIGDCLQKVYRFCGDNVNSDIHLGDWGTQMGMLIEAIRKLDPSLPYFQEDFTGEYPKESPVTVEDLSLLYPKASTLCKEDETEMQKARIATAELQDGNKGYRALWQHFIDVSIAGLKKDFARLDVNFDLWKGESDARNIIPEMLNEFAKQGFSEKSEGAIIIKVAESEEDNTPPLILVKSDGAAIYGTTDMATIVDRVENLNADSILYVVDQRQGLHFKQLFAASKKCGIAENTELRHIGFGTVNGEDGKPFKTRSGGVMKLGTLIDEAIKKANLRSDESFNKEELSDITNKIAMAMVKFADLSNNRTSDYIFDLDKFSKFEGKTGPYLLYSAVRIKSIMRKAESLGYINDDIMPATNNSERNLQLAFMQLPTAIQRTYDLCEPHHLCDFAYNLATVFSRFYNDSHILNEEDAKIRGSRLKLAELTLTQLELVLNLLGIEIPEKM